MSRPYPDPTTIEFTCSECGRDGARGKHLPKLTMAGPRVMWECPHCDCIAIRQLPPVARKAFAALLDDPLTPAELASMLLVLGDDDELAAAVADIETGRL